MTEEDREPDAPADILVRARWVRGADRAWADRCNQIMMEHGIVSSKRAYDKRTTAKRRAARLRTLLARLGLHEEWQMVTHTERKDNGWCWHLEYIGERDDRAKPKHSSAA